MEKQYKMCQSCGMPLSKDPNGGGTEKDESKSPKYCSYCYLSGEFTFTGTVHEFQAHCKQKMVEGGHSKFISWIFTRGLKRLERWENN
ncbi:zinc ribbon domain-containing protein [Maribellus maritimus]|uniref:zinc ribbon domain-containing protein n=1 Tax=Maribellus maritimus TaxID=2870838 RepID=UPI001EEC6718|nr:zinc ribbon domain-containing protein [Maribellus maritimus]MCG6186203.1 zinc ribbon domain-containing protein [Maribellus maritimus]